MTVAEYYMVLYGYCYPKPLGCMGNNYNCSECGLKDWFEHHFDFEDYEHFRDRQKVLNKSRNTGVVHWITEKDIIL